MGGAEREPPDGRLGLSTVVNAMTAEVDRLIRVLRAPMWKQEPVDIQTAALQAADALSRLQREREACVSACQAWRGMYEAKEAELQEQQRVVEGLRKDAERYRWLRPRLWVRDIRDMTGALRPALYVVIGRSFFHTKTDAHEDQEREQLDSAIDAAIKEK